MYIDDGSKRGREERGVRRGAGAVRQVFNKLISFPMLLSSFSFSLSI